MSSPASPKRRPAPTRSLRQPQSLSVNEAGSTWSGGGARTTDTAALRQSYQDRAEANKATMIAMESLLEDVPVSRDAFKEACNYLLPSSYLSILHERHLSSLCSHPLCPNPPAKPFTSFSIPRSRIVRDPSDGSKRIVEVTGNEEDGFCSKECWKRSEWVRRSGMLGEEGRWLRGKDGASGGEVGKKWELLEEVEERLERERLVEEEKEMERRAWEEAEKVRKVASREEGEGSREDGSAEVSAASRPADITSSPPSPPAATSAPPPPPSPSLPAPLESLNPTLAPSSPSPSSPTPPVSGPAALIASLTIKERATPSLLPQPPTLNPTPPNASPKPSSSSSPSSSSPKPTPKIGSSPPPMSHKTAARLKEERRRADASSQTLIPGSVGGLGRMGDVLVGASSGGGKGKGKFEKSSAGKTKEVESEEGEAKVEVPDDDEEEDVDGLKDVWEEMYKARGELEERGGEEETT